MAQINSYPDATETTGAKMIGHQDGTTKEVPAALFADADHEHAIADTTGLQAALDAKADAAATTSALAGKAATSHTHTASNVTDFSEAVDDRVAGLLVAGANVTLTYNDGAGTLTIAAAGGGEGGGLGDGDYGDVTVSGSGTTIAINADAVTLAKLDDEVTAEALGGAAASHTHAQSDITDLVDDLAAKADASSVTSALAGKANTSHTHAQSDVTNLVTDLAGKVGTARNVSTQHSLTGGGNLSADRTLALVNDTASPGNNKVYGTDGSGARGWKDDPAGAVDSVNGETGVVTLGLEQVGASAFGASLAGAEDADAALTVLGLAAMGDLDANEFLVGAGEGNNPVPKTPAEVLAILGMASSAAPLGWELTEEAADGTYSFVCSMPRAGSVTGLTHVCASRSAGVLAVKIAGVDVTSLTSIAPSTTKTTTSATGANTFDAGDEVTLVVSGTSDITGLRATLNLAWG